MAGTLEVVAHWEGGYKCTLPVRRFQITVDEPPIFANRSARRSGWARTTSCTWASTAGESSADAGSRFTLMLGLGALLVRALDLPAVDQAEWSSFIRRLVGAFTDETHP